MGSAWLVGVVVGLLPLVYVGAGVVTVLADAFYHAWKFKEVPPMAVPQTVRIVALWPWYAAAASRKLIEGFMAQMEQRERLR